jgi:hypothetical protein
MLGALIIFGCTNDDDDDDPPVAVDDTATTLEDRAVQINVLANDINVVEDDDDDDGDDDDGDDDDLTVTITTAPTNGTATVNANNSVTYTPNLNFNGPDRFTYTVDNRDGGTDTAEVTVGVAPVNDPPVAADDTATTAEDTAVDINVLANDSDVEDDDLTVTITTAPTNGTATVNANNSVTYTPNADFNGQDTFTYTVDDGNDTDTAEVTVTVTPVNDPFVDAAEVPAELSNRAFAFDDGNVFGIADAATLTFGQFVGNTAPFTLEAGDQIAHGMATLTSCDLEVVSSTFEAGQGPQARDLIILDPCRIDAQDNDVLRVTNGGITATSGPAVSDSESIRIILPVVLDGDQENPPVETEATGTGILTVNVARDTITFTLTYQGIVSNVTVAHIHAGARGLNGDPIFFFCEDEDPLPGVEQCPEPTEAPVTLSGSLTEDDFQPTTNPTLPVATFAAAIEAIRAGNTYFNVHSEDSRTGEIRGQVENPPAPE